jgi:hypothetical protein
MDTDNMPDRPISPGDASSRPNVALFAVRRLFKRYRNCSGMPSALLQDLLISLFFMGFLTLEM